jgi:integrase
MEQDMPTGLIRRGARYSIRRRVPLDLVAHFGGKAEVVEALGTADPKEARRLWPLRWAAIQERFDLAHAEIAAGKTEPEKPVSSLSPTLIALVNLDRFRTERDAAAQRGELAAYMREKRDALRLMQAMLDGEVPATEDLRHIEGLRNGLRAMLSGENAFAISAARQARAAITEAEESAAGNPTLREVHELWIKHQARPVSTLRAMRLAVERFEQLIGDKRVRDVSRRDVTAFIDKAREPGVLASKGFSIPNMNSTLSMLSALFGYAVRRNLIENNPATNTQIQDTRRPREKRREFDAPALAAIFGSPVYTQGARPDGGAGEAAYWIPLLALYTGARIGELCQLHPDDVTQEGYLDAKGKRQTAWVLRIEQNKARGQKVKTEGSERRIPVHADLIKLGFIDYAKGQGGKHLLFDKIKAGNSEGRLSMAWGQWFSDYLRTKCGVTDDRMTFHSFRHTFKHQARQALIPADVHNALTGHETRSAADAYGGLSYPLHPLVEGMKRYAVAEFRLPAPPSLRSEAA